MSGAYVSNGTTLASFPFSTFQAWLEKLCGEAATGVENKRNRNIYLSNLVLCMQEGQLTPPFQIPPAEADISNAREVFGLESPKVTVSCNVLRN